VGTGKTAINSFLDISFYERSQVGLFGGKVIGKLIESAIVSVH
jgi:hypothetical protein